jgi:hypothetical protein
MGIILGSRSNRVISADANKLKNLSKQSTRRNPSILAAALALIFSLIAIAPMIQDIRFKSALNGKSADKLLDAALIWPRNIYYLNFGSQLLRQSDLQELASKLAKVSIQVNNRNIVGYMEIVSNSSISKAQRLDALTQIRFLDPSSHLYVNFE